MVMPASGFRHDSVAHETISQSQQAKHDECRCAGAPREPYVVHVQKLVEHDRKHDSTNGGAYKRKRIET